ncbi:MAG: trigger factor [Vicinamibacteraceae bacterium]|nr:trigger factor [Vicinamibacteraceae bacterium]
MKTEFRDVSTTQKQLVFEIPVDEVDVEVERVARDYARQVRLPGFRPGKAPLKVVRQRFREQIRRDALQELIPRVLDEALRERALEPVATPDIRDVSFEEGQPLAFTADFETVPPIDPIDYSTMTLRKPPIVVEDQAVDSMLERLRERSARFEPVERPSQYGDVLSADLARRPITIRDEAQQVIEAPEAAPEQHEDIGIEIGGAANPPGFDAEITGLGAGESKTFVSRFPEDYAVADLAGTSVEYSVRVRGVKEKVLPVLDDEFAKDLGAFDSLDALRDRVRDDIRHQQEHQQEHELRDDLLRQLASRIPFEVPEALVARELDRRTDEFVRRLLEQQVDPLRAGIDWNEFRDRQRPAAIDSVKSMLALDDVARRETITVTEEEAAEELGRISRGTGLSVQEVRDRIAKDGGGLGRFYAGLRREKTVKWLMEKVTTVDF